MVKFNTLTSLTLIVLTLAFLFILLILNLNVYTNPIANSTTLLAAASPVAATTTTTTSSNSHNKKLATIATPTSSSTKNAALTTPASLADNPASSPNVALTSGILSSSIHQNSNTADTNIKGSNASSVIDGSAEKATEFSSTSSTSSDTDSEVKLHFARKQNLIQAPETDHHQHHRNPTNTYTHHSQHPASTLSPQHHHQQNINSHEHEILDVNNNNINNSNRDSKNQELLMMNSNTNNNSNNTTSQEETATTTSSSSSSSTSSSSAATIATSATTNCINDKNTPILAVHKNNESSKYFDIDFASQVFDESMIDPSAISLSHYIAGFKELMKFFYSLGSIFLFVTSDLENKIGLLENYRNVERGPCNPDYFTIQSTIDYETKENLLRDSKRQSGARTILRLHRALEFLSMLMLNLSKLDEDSETAPAARDAYSNSLAKHHPWTIRTIASFAMRTLPQKKLLVESVLGKEYLSDMTSSNEKMLKLANVTDNLFQIVDKYYDEREIRDLP